METIVVLWQGCRDYVPAAVRWVSRKARALAWLNCAAKPRNIRRRYFTACRCSRRCPYPCCPRCRRYTPTWHGSRKRRLPRRRLRSNHEPLRPPTPSWTWSPLAASSPLGPVDRRTRHHVDRCTSSAQRVDSYGATRYLIGVIVDSSRRDLFY